MKKLVALLAMVLALSSCYWQPPDPALQSDFDPVFSEVLAIGASTVQDIGVWLWYEFDYVDDSLSHGAPEYWQSPVQTYQNRAGDCEDFAILMMYMIRQELGGRPEMILGYLNGNRHAWVLYDGQEYEPRYGSNVTGNLYFVIEEVISYGEALWRSLNLHRSLESL